MALVDVCGARCSDGHVGDEEELLKPGRPPRRLRLAALLLAVLLGAAVIAIRVWPRSTHPSAAVPPGTTAVPSAVSPSTPETKTPPPWPTAPEACGGVAELPIVSSTATKERTGIKVLLGGDELRTVDFDRGDASALPRSPLRPGEFVYDLIPASQTYAVTGGCNFTQARVLRIGADGRASVFVRSGPFGDAVLADGSHAWGVTFPDEQHPNGSLVPLDGGKRVRLPAGFLPAAITNGVVIGTAGSPPSVLLVDATTGHVRANLGKGSDFAAGHGLVLWTEGCDFASDTRKPCTLHRRSVAGGETSSYRLPRPPAAGTISPDGGQIAFTLERAGPDPRYQPGIPLPTDIAILHLDTGALGIVPGIEAPARKGPGLAFSPDSRWLVIALNAGSKTRLLAWRSGLANPYESTPIAGKGLGIPPIVVLTSHTDG
jgi:hypothetical protein